MAALARFNKAFFFADALEARKELELVNNEDSENRHHDDPAEKRCTEVGGASHQHGKTDDRENENQVVCVLHFLP